jgi:hypothetical protein
MEPVKHETHKVKSDSTVGALQNLRAACIILGYRGTTRR